MTITEWVRREWVSIDDARWSQAHASSVIRHGQSVLVAWFAGTREGTPDNRIWLTRKHDDEEGWSTPVALTTDAVAHWNPVLAHSPAGELWLFYKSGARISGWTTWVRKSGDGGTSWSEPDQLVPGDTFGRGPVRNPPLLLDDGTWLAPGSREHWGEQVVWESFVDISWDDGASWTARPIPVDRAALRGAGVIQPALWRSGETVKALLRSTEGRAFLSASADGGMTWSRAEPVELANNNSGLTVVALDDGRAVCVHNPVSADWGARCPLVVSVSEDGGATWAERVCIEDGRTPIDDDPRRRPSLPNTARSAADEPPLFGGGDDGVVTTGIGEYSYPAAVPADDRPGSHLLITYSWQRRGFVAARVPLSLLATQAPTSTPRSEAS